MWSKKNLKRVYVYSTLCAFLLVGLLALIFYGLFSQLSGQYARDYFGSLTNKSAQAAENSLNEMEKVAKLASYSSSVQSYIFESDVSKKLASKEAATDLLDSVLDSFPGIREIAFIKTDGSVIQSTGIFSGLLNKAFNESKPATVPDGFSDQPFYSEVFYNTQVTPVSDIPYFFYAYPVYSLIKGSFLPKYAATCLVISRLDDLIGKHLQDFKVPDSSMAILQGNHILLPKALPQDTKTAFLTTLNGENRLYLEGQNYLAYRQIIAKTPWSIIFFTPEDSLTQNLYILKAFSLIFLSLSFLCLLILMLFGMRSISAPIHELLSQINLISIEEKGKLPESSIYEINQISSSINKMLDKIDLLATEQVETKEKLYKALLDRKQAELHYYRSQINPHFLYNTLECIRAMAQSYGADCIGSMCASMARMFRYSVSPATEATLEEELRHVQNYFYVISQRLGDRYQLHINISEEALRQPIQKMVLQPLVENAIQHGFEGKDSPCIISVFSCLKAGKLYLRVADNGRGIPPRQLRRLNKALSALDETVDHLSPESGIGLTNINRRLHAVYNEHFQMQIYSRYGCFTSVELHFPAAVIETTPDQNKLT